MSADVTLGQDQQGPGPIVAQIVRNPWSAKDIWTNTQTVSRTPHLGGLKGGGVLNALVSC